MYDMTLHKSCLATTFIDGLVKQVSHSYICAKPIQPHSLKVLFGGFPEVFLNVNFVMSICSSLPQKITFILKCSTFSKCSPAKNLYLL